MITSFSSFGLFILGTLCAILYYAFPKKHRWILLLGVSLFYYASAGPLFLLYLFFAAVTTWVGARFAARGIRAAVVLPLILDFGVLAWLKYYALAASYLNRIPGINLPYFRILMPLGISFYTFQSLGYLLDVYWKRCEAEKSFLRYLLFVSFYPQLMQGPIGRFGTLSGELFNGHDYDPAAIRRGLLRIAWGFFKKMAVADNAALYVNRIFDGYMDIRGLGIQGVLMYSIQLYADFSGGIDVALGFSEILGIKLDENFRQPYFAQTLTDFWHRWHITLGTWMKDYLFYPISLSSWMGRFRKFSRKVFGKETGRALSVGVANVIVFIAVGIWHGAGGHFIAYGLYNGLIIAGGGLLAGTFRNWKKRIGITDRTAWFQAFRMIRTFVIVNISWFLDRSGSVGQAWQMLRDSFRGKVFSLAVISPGNPEYCIRHFLPIVFGSMVILIASILKEKKKDIRGRLAKLPVPVFAAILIGVMFVCAIYGNKDGGGFIYANF